MFIMTEQTPNPATLKFLPGRVVAQATTEIAKAEQARSPLAQILYKIDGVDSIMLGADFITVSKSASKDWTILKPMVLAAIMDHFTSGRPALLDDDAPPPEALPALDDDDVTAQIRAIIDSRVRPAVAQDGGDITFERFAEGVVYVRLKGSCAGCPSSSATLKSGIENMLRHYVPEVDSVEAVN